MHYYSQNLCLLYTISAIRALAELTLTVTMDNVHVDLTTSAILT